MCSCIFICIFVYMYLLIDLFICNVMSRNRLLLRRLVSVDRSPKLIPPSLLKARLSKSFHLARSFRRHPQKHRFLLVCWHGFGGTHGRAWHGPARTSDMSSFSKIPMSAACNRKPKTVRKNQGLACPSCESVRSKASSFSQECSTQKPNRFEREALVFGITGLCNFKRTYEAKAWLHRLRARQAPRARCHGHARVGCPALS